MSFSVKYGAGGKIWLNVDGMLARGFSKPETPEVTKYPYYSVDLYVNILGFLVFFF